MSDAPFAKKSLGQHWLHDQASLEAMCTAAEVSQNDTVLEIGPGLGTLTDLLTKRVGHVIAVELDKILAANLPGKLKAPNLEVVNADILSFDFTSLPPGYKVVANIPYYLTGHLLRTLSETANPPHSATLLVQKEVARRLNAAPGDMSLLSVTVQFYWQVDLGREVPAKLFMPPPKVDSQIVVLTRRQKPLFPGLDEAKFFRIIKAAFSQRRKTLLNTLSSGLQLERDLTRNVCQSAGIDPGRRAQTLSLNDWYKLYNALMLDALSV
ncbi:MAG TPA: 16S rRNA (adenine(1518)-N(6)/adenine(1519)-N(6))-dimethyltransferase RsmA [Candidatus Dormibacteraeota bacterium]|nr:16S rRNA (adenine(1518)-N(6)/adenine(1519)-N(6))-dimethyltransferase RsmA [Candidatus Dormibacteraeota bacterium]